MADDYIEKLAEQIYERERFSPQQCTWEQMKMGWGPMFYGQTISKYRRIAAEMALTDY